MSCVCTSARDSAYRRTNGVYRHAPGIPHSQKKCSKQLFPFLLLYIIYTVLMLSQWQVRKLKKAGFELKVQCRNYYCWLGLRCILLLKVKPCSQSKLPLPFASVFKKNCQSIFKVKVILICDFFHQTLQMETRKHITDMIQERFKELKSETRLLHSKWR